MAAGAFDYTFSTSTRDVGLVRVVVAYADADPVPVPVSSLVPGEVLRLDLLRVLNAWIKPRQKRYIASYRPREDALDPDENKLMGQVDANRIEFDEFVESSKVQDVLSNGFELGSKVQADNTVREFSVVSGLDVVTKTPATAMSVRETVRISTAKIKYVGDAYHEQISEILYNGYVDGTSTKDLAKLLQGRNSVLNSRAEFIARNEMGNMYAKLTEIRQTENGVVSYIWRTSEDERVRPSHAAKNGQVFQWTDPPPDTGNPGADYNCRCYAEPVLDAIDPEITGQVGSPGEPAIGVEAVEAMTMKPLPPIVEPVETFSAFIEVNSREEMNAFKRSLKELKFQKNARYVSQKEAAEEGGAWGFHLTDLTDDQMNKINSKRWRDKTGYSKGFNLYPDTEWKPPKESFGIFPTSLDALEEIKALGGSTGAKLVRDPETGTQFVLKRGKNPAHIQEEFLTNEMYRALGTKVPDSRLYNGDTMLSEYIEGTAFSKLKGSDRVRAQLHAQGDFVPDALLGNWDVAGLDLDNLLVDKSGNVWRIDNGAGLRFRAQGAPKGNAFDEWNTELWTLRDATKNKSAAEVFEHVEWNEHLERNIERTLKKRSEVMALIEDASLKRTMAARFDNLEEVLALSKEMRSDGWDNNYVDMFSKQRAAMGKSGMRERMPEELTPVGHSSRFQGGGPDKDWSPNEMLQSKSESRNMNSIPAVRDEDGKLWDDLRGEDGIMRRYFDHLDTIAEGNKKYSEELAQIHMKWADDQASSSWDPRSQAMKVWLANKRGADNSNVWWRDGKGRAERHLEEFIEELPDPKQYGISKTREQLFDETLSSFHAMNYDVLKKADLPTKSADNSKLLVVRTENASVLRRQDMNTLGAEGEIQRGASESASMFRTYYYKGDNVVWSEVPLHRVVASYLPDRGAEAFNAKYGKGMSREGMFAGDDENEIVVFFGDSKSKVMAKTVTQRGQDEWNKLEASDWTGGVTATTAKAKKAPLPGDVTFAKSASGSAKIPASGKLDPVEVNWKKIDPQIIALSEQAGVDLSDVKISNPVLLEKIQSSSVKEVTENILLTQPMSMSPPAYIPKHLWSPGEPWKNFKLMAEYDPKAVAPAASKAAAKKVKFSAPPTIVESFEAKGIDIGELGESVTNKSIKLEHKSSSTQWNAVLEQAEEKVAPDYIQLGIDMFDGPAWKDLSLTQRVKIVSEFNVSDDIEELFAKVLALKKKAPAAKAVAKKAKAKLKPIEVDWGELDPDIIGFAEEAGVDLSKVKISNPVLLEKIEQGSSTKEILEEVLSKQPWQPTPPKYIPKHLWASPLDDGGWKNFKLMAEYDPKKVAKKAAAKAAPVVKPKVKASKKSAGEYAIHLGGKEVGKISKWKNEWIFDPSGDPHSWPVGHQFANTKKELMKKLNEAEWTTAD